MSRIMFYLVKTDTDNLLAACFLGYTHLLIVHESVSQKVHDIAIVQVLRVSDMRYDLDFSLAILLVGYIPYENDHIDCVGL